MESIETLAVQTYQKNLEYFSKYHTELANKLNTFNFELENGSYPPKYDLEYIKDYFDVKELKSNQYLYAGDSNKISKELTNLVDFHKNSYSFEGFPIYNFSDEALEKLSERQNSLDGLYLPMRYYIENSKLDDKMIRVEKFIFIGTGLGQHILNIHGKIKAKIYLIIEDDIELFRLSLFSTSYFELAQKSELYFSIADNENIFLQTAEQFLDNSFYNNRYLKYSYFPAHSNNKIKQIQNALTTQSFVIFPYKMKLRKLLKPLEYINDGYNILNLSQQFSNSIFSQKPMLLVTAGPSLQKNIQWLMDNHDKFIIIAVSATLKTLYENDITPDVVTHIDGLQTSLIHYKDIPIQSFLKDAHIILGPFTPSNLRVMFTKEQIYYYEDLTNYFKHFGLVGGPCVGSFSLLLSLIFGTKELYLLGLDLALDQNTGSSHYEQHDYNRKTDLSKKDDLKNLMTMRQNIFPVAGNLTTPVYTTPLFHASIQFLYTNIAKFKSNNQAVYNLNEGANINLAIAKNITDIDISSYEKLDKKNLSISIASELNQHSSIKLSNDDISSLKQNLENSRQIKAYILNYINSVSHKNTDRYIYDLFGVVSEILKSTHGNAKDLATIYYDFFKYILPIIIDFFNTAGLKNNKRHIKKLDKMVQDELMMIENIYEETLDEFIQNRC